MPKSMDEMQTEHDETTFQDSVFDDECLLSWLRGHLSDSEIVERLKHFKSKLNDGPQVDEWRQNDCPSFKRNTSWGG